MRQIGTQSSRYFRKIVTFVLAFALIVTSMAVSSIDSQAAKKARKVKKVTIGVKVGSSGILVLKKGQKKKLKVSVTPKKASKKVTYKSSKKSVVSVSSKGVVKARKSKGSAKITVTSKQNKKKKATIKVKIGTPIKKVSIQKKAVSNWTGTNWVLKEVNGQKKKVWPQYKETLTADKGTYKVMRGRTVTLKTTTSPKKPAYKKYKWTSSKSSVISIPSGANTGTSCKVSAKKEGTATVTATAMDGSGKKAKVKFNVVRFISDKTPAPTAPPDTRIRTTIDDFESYAVGTAWNNFTAANKLNADGTSPSGSMTVVTDPEDANNKCLQIKYTGPDAYDFAPVFNVDLEKLKDSLGNSAAGKTLKNYTGVKMNARVVGTSGDVTYKQIYCYFDQYGKIAKTDKFAANDNKSSSAHVDKDGNAVAAGAPNEDRSLRFGVNIPMAEGTDAKTGGTLFNGNASQEVNKYFPCYYGVWNVQDANTHYTANSCSVGFKLKEADGKVGFADRTVTMNTARINEADSTLLNQSKFDVVLGSTYGGSTKNTDNTDLTLYLDNIALVEEPVPITDFTLSIPAGQDVVYPGGSVKANVVYTPENTTQKDLTWTTNNEKVKADTEGNISVAEDIVLANNETTEVVVTATSKANTALTKSVVIKVAPIQIPTEPYVVDFDTMYDQELSGDLTVEKTQDAEGVDCWKFNFTDKNQRIYFKLPEEVNLSAYQKYEMVGFVPAQMSIDFFDASLPEAQAKNTDASPFEWWKTASAGTYPFYGGSSSNRLEDGTWVEPNDKETESVILSQIKKSQASSTDPEVGDYNKTKYIALGNATGSDFVPGTYYIYSLKLTPKPTGELKKLPISTLPVAESFEGETVSLNGITDSVVTEGAAQDGTHYLDVAEGENPGILIDNREGTADAKYLVSAWVKVKDADKAGKVTFLSKGTYTAKEYEAYDGYAEVETLLGNKTTTKDLSASSEWQQIQGMITVKAGKISEMNIGAESADSTFPFLLDNVTVTPR